MQHKLVYNSYLVISLCQKLRETHLSPFTNNNTQSSVLSMRRLVISAHPPWLLGQGKWKLFFYCLWISNINFHVTQCTGNLPTCTSIVYMCIQVLKAAVEVKRFLKWAKRMPGGDDEPNQSQEASAAGSRFKSYKSSVEWDGELEIDPEQEMVGRLMWVNVWTGRQLSSNSLVLAPQTRYQMIGCSEVMPSHCYVSCHFWGVLVK